MYWSNDSADLVIVIGGCLYRMTQVPISLILAVSEPTGILE